MSQHEKSISPGSKYTVQQGDTLSDIAQQAYNDSEDWDTIYNANKQVIGNNPNLIKPGQVLQIPVQSDPGPGPTPPPPDPTPPPNPTPSGGDGEDSDSPVDWLRNELNQKKED